MPTNNMQYNVYIIIIILYILAKINWGWHNYHKNLQLKLNN